MFYLGIDIGKRSHVASLMNSEGKVIFKGFSFANSSEGVQSLLECLAIIYPDPNQFLFDMEVTGHYLLALFSYLDEQVFLLM